MLIQHRRLPFATQSAFHNFNAPVHLLAIYERRLRAEEALIL